MSCILGIHSGVSVRDGMTAMQAPLSYAPNGKEWAEDGVGLGFRQTPGAVGVGLHFDKEAGLALAAHVRLDDRDGLGAALGLSGPECASLADGELVLRSCRKWGRDAPSRLVGDYAFALWDARRRSLLCARDHIGARPFYYALTAKAFVFAGSLDAVLAAPGVSDELDEAMATAWLTHVGLHENSRTLFKDAHKLPPGHSLIVRGGPAHGSRSVRLLRHWRLEEAPSIRRASDDDCAAELLALCRSAVQARHAAAPPGQAAAPRPFCGPAAHPTAAAARRPPERAHGGLGRGRHPSRP